MLSVFFRSDEIKTNVTNVPLIAVLFIFLSLRVFKIFVEIDAMLGYV